MGELRARRERKARKAAKKIKKKEKKLAKRAREAAMLGIVEEVSSSLSPPRISRRGSVSGTKQICLQKYGADLAVVAEEPVSSSCASSSSSGRARPVKPAADEVSSSDPDASLAEKAASI